MYYSIENPTRHLFYTGKGGVGKTSIATATAVALADRGRRVLLVSTDPASNLGQVLETDVGDHVKPVRAVPGLHTLNINPEAAAAAYRERVLAPVRDRLPEAAVAQVAEQLSGACTTEIAAFDQFTRLLADPDHDGRFDHVVFDTAPTGHTLRLLQLPSAWSSFIDENPDGASCLGPLSGLASQQHQYAAAVTALNTPDLTTLVLVTRPERSALKEAARTSEELAQLGVSNQRLVVNGVFRATTGDPIAQAMEQRASDALEAMPGNLRTLPSEMVPLQPHNLVGLAALRALVDSPNPRAAGLATDPGSSLELPPLATLVDELETDGKGLVMVMGKGGVGKTTIAAAIAVELAARGHDVHLTTTDPAAHLAGTVSQDVDGLTLTRIDPKIETNRYIDHVMRTKGPNLDEDGRQLLLEDLRSPCTEEVAVFHAFSRAVRQAARSFVVVDTAPTGHTLLLLDQTGSYHREVLRNSRVSPDRIVTPLMRLQDPSYTKLLVVTLPETTPVLEAAQLQSDVRRAGVEPYAWIVNQSLAACSVQDPLLQARAAAEVEQIEKVQSTLSDRVVLCPWMVEEPVGRESLSTLVSGAEVAPAL